MGQNFSRLIEISLVDKRDLGRRENFGPIWTQLSRLAGKLSVYNFTKSCHSGKLYPVSGITFLHMNKTKLFDSSKCFLANRDNFCPYEQALKLINLYVGVRNRNVKFGKKVVLRSLRILHIFILYASLSHLGLPNLICLKSWARFNGPFPFQTKFWKKSKSAKISP